MRTQVKYKSERRENRRKNQGKAGVLHGKTSVALIRDMVIRRGKEAAGAISRLPAAERITNDSDQ